LRHSRIGVLRVVAARIPPDGPLTKSTRFALDPAERSAIIDDEVIARVLAKRQSDTETSVL
jgi:hypothetical protein